MKPPDSAGPGKTFVALRELNVFHKGHSRMFGKIAPAVCLGKIPALVRETAEADYLDFRNARAFYINNLECAMSGNDIELNKDVSISLCIF